jgi:hypothetical protein
MTLYFAYGSNMNRAAMRRRCPGARAMLYLLRGRATGRPRPGYVAMIAASARDWSLPERYIRSVERLRTSRFTGARMLDAGDQA